VCAARRFTPTVEVELCGHATLAAAHALYETKRVPALQAITFQTKYSGTLTATEQSNGSIELNFPVTPVTPVTLSAELHTALQEALSLNSEDILSTGKSIYDLVVEVTREAFARLAGTTIDFAKIYEQGGRCVLVTCLGGARAGSVDLSGLKDSPPRTPQAAVVNDTRFDFLSRAFVPRYHRRSSFNRAFVLIALFSRRYGINEDPVTGSARCALAPYWTTRITALPSGSATVGAPAGGLTKLVGYQASARGGVVAVTVDGDRVRLAGHAVTTVRCKVLV
jgi:predicted PhzF superfamily epimerase YddE/YHI9